jgi:hypothetical protein
VSDDDLRQRLEVYGPGLDAEITLLQQLQQLAHAQRDASTSDNLLALPHFAQERDRIMAALVTLEHELRPSRLVLAAHREEASHIPGFDHVRERHKLATDLVAAIVQSDQDTLQALQDAELARRFAARTLNTGGETVAAYRRVVAPPVSGAGLVDRRG